MRRMLLAAGLVVAVAPLGVSMSACKKDKKKDDKTAPVATDDKAGGETPAGGQEHGSGQGGGQGGGANNMTNKMMHCPSAVVGSATKVETGKESVVLTITSSDAAKVAEIQKRAKHLAGLSSDAAPPELKHTGQGTGGGALGKCPVVMRDVTLKVEDQKDGAKVTVTPKNAASLAELGRISKERADALAAAAADEEGEDDEAADEE